MASLQIHSQSGVSTGATHVVDETRIAVRVNSVLLRSALVMYSANRRVGTSKSKSRAEVSGSSRKLYKQKGTGNARAGNKRTPIRRGGGHCFAKRPADWRISMPRKSLRRAAAMAVLLKINGGRLVVLDELHYDVPRTRSVADMLDALGVGSSSCLIVVSKHDSIVWKSCRNLPAVTVVVASDLNADDVVRASFMVATKSSLQLLCERFSSCVKVGA